MVGFFKLTTVQPCGREGAVEQTHVLKKVVVFVPVDGKNPIQFLKDHGYASKDVREYGEAETQDPNRTSFLDLKILFKAKSCGLKFFMLNLYAAEYYFLPPGWYHFFLLLKVLGLTWR